MNLWILFSSTLLFNAGYSRAQNMGVGTANPSEKLEVAGMIYTNDGGIKFPDETIQTTAAFMDPPETYPEERGVGFIEWKNAELDGSLDTIGLHKLSLLYSYSIDFQNLINDIEFGEFQLVKQTDKGSPGLFKFLINESIIPNVTIHLTRPDNEGNLEVYYKIKLTNVFVFRHMPSIAPALDGFYQHTDKVSLGFITMTLHDVDSGKCYCFNVVTNVPCGCP